MSTIYRLTPNRVIGKNMKYFIKLILLSFILVAQSWNTAIADQLNIVSWNMQATLKEGLQKRLSDFSLIADELNPDVLILIEVAGRDEVELIAKEIGWKKYNVAISNWGVLRSSVYSALEVAVISKISFEKVVEFDASPDGVHEVFNQDGIVLGKISEELFSSEGIQGFGDPLAKTDRGTMRVDLINGLSIFPVHLKSNNNGVCSSLNSTIKFLKKNNFNVEPDLEDAYLNGLESAVVVDIRNAKKRERVMAATAKLATEALNNGRIAIIAGDFNTSFEKGKYGGKISDCDVQPHSCKRGPFPANACTNGDGFDDTLGMLVEGLILKQKWKVLSEKLGKTYKGNVFADLAIDHIAVSIEHSKYFTAATKSEKRYGSDHYPIFTTFNIP